MRALRHFLALMLVITGLMLSSCNLPGAASPTPNIVDELEDRSPVFTQVAQTIVAELTLNAPPPTQGIKDVGNPTSTSGEEFLETTSTGTIFPSIEETIVETPAPAATGDGDSMPVITASIDTNCRFGPDPSWEVTGYLLVGDESTVHAKSPNGYWWYIENPDVQGDFCWVWTETTVVEGDIDSIPVRQPPATLTPTPTNTLTPTLTSTITPTEEVNP